jgi:hypothetical protein
VSYWDNEKVIGDKLDINSVYGKSLFLDSKDVSIRLRSLKYTICFSFGSKSFENHASLLEFFEPHFLYERVYSLVLTKRVMDVKLCLRLEI